MNDEEVNNFIEIMNNTCFIKTDISVPYGTMMQEFDNFLKNNRLDLVPFKTDPTRAFNLDVLGLIDLVDDPQQAGTYILGNMRRNLSIQKTTLYEFFPKTIDWIFENIPGVFRCKISRLKAGETANWHDHPHRLQKFDTVFHIPLITDKDVKMYVRFKESPEIEHSCHFTEGNLWYFNSGPTVEHAVKNESQRDRWHLWINALVIDKYNNTKNQQLVDSLLRANN